MYNDKHFVNNYIITYNIVIAAMLKLNSRFEAKYFCNTV